MMPDDMDPLLQGFIDLVVVPALTERLARERTRTASPYEPVGGAMTAPGAGTHGAAAPPEPPLAGACIPIPGTHSS
jgi:hypothetical protein